MICTRCSIFVGKYQINIYFSPFIFKTVLAPSLFDTKKWYFHQIFKLTPTVVRLKGLVKVPLFCVKQRLCKHCFKNEWTLSLIFLPSWKRLLLQTTTDGQVAVKCIAKTFASGKTEKLVYDTLASLELPSEKVKIRKIITNKTQRQTQKSNSLLFVWHFCTSNMLFAALSVMGFKIIKNWF